MDYSKIKAIVALAVRDGVSVRRSFYEAISEPDGQTLGTPTTATDIRALEERLGAPIPPSYRAFLEQHDGWKMFDAAVDLYSVSELLLQNASPSMAKWRDIAQNVEGVNARAWLVIGGSRISGAKYLLDSSRTNTSGEMVVIEHDKIVESEYDSFLHMLLDQNDVYKQGVDDIDGVFDFTNV